MAGIYRISECKDEYVDHHPYPGQIQRPYLPKIPDNLKVFCCTHRLENCVISFSNHIGIFCY